MKKLNINHVNKNIEYLNIDINNLSISVHNFNELNILYKNFIYNFYDKKIYDKKNILIVLNSIPKIYSLIFCCFYYNIPIIVYDIRNLNYLKENELDHKLEVYGEIDLYYHYNYKESLQNDKSKEKDNYVLNYAKNFVSDLEMPFHSISEKFYDFIQLKNIIKNKENISLITSTSGTESKPKKINYTHEFLYDVVMYNKNIFYGNCGIIYAFHHGGAVATYFLPVLFSENTKKIINFNGYDSNKTISMKYLYENKLDFLLFPYSDMLKDYLYFLEKNNLKDENLNAITLSFIDEEMKSYVDRGYIKNVISFFGSNETSGPTLINHCKKENFNPRYYTLFNKNFYKHHFDENSILLVNVNDRIINTKDKFKHIEKDTYEFLGRDNFYRINDIVINKEEIEKLIKEKFDFLLKKIINDTYKNKNDLNSIKDKITLELIVDLVYNDLKLVFFDDLNILFNYINELKNMIKEINFVLENRFNNLIYIKQAAITGSIKYFHRLSHKIDMELLRKYLRNKENCFYVKE